MCHPRTAAIRGSTARASRACRAPWRPPYTPAGLRSAPLSHERSRCSPGRRGRARAARQRAHPRSGQAARQRKLTGERPPFGQSQHQRLDERRVPRGGDPGSDLSKAVSGFKARRGGAIARIAECVDERWNAAGIADLAERSRARAAHPRVGVIPQGGDQRLGGALATLRKGSRRRGANPIIWGCQPIDEQAQRDRRERREGGVLGLVGDFVPGQDADRQEGSRIPDLGEGRARGYTHGDVVVLKRLDQWLYGPFVGQLAQCLCGRGAPLGILVAEDGDQLLDVALLLQPFDADVHHRPDSLRTRGRVLMAAGGAGRARRLRRTLQGEACSTLFQKDPIARTRSKMCQ